MSEESVIQFVENSACRGCEHLQECRDEGKPRRTSCWILRVRDYWKPRLGPGAEAKQHEDQS